jgi:hypothetical protein
MQVLQLYINPQNLIHTLLYTESKIYYYNYYYYHHHHLLLCLYVIIFCLNDLAVTLIYYCLFIHCVKDENFFLHPPLRLLNVIKSPGL